MYVCMYVCMYVEKLLKAWSFFKYIKYFLNMKALLITKFKSELHRQLFIYLFIYLFIFWNRIGEYLLSKEN